LLFLALVLILWFSRALFDCHELGNEQRTTNNEQRSKVDVRKGVLATHQQLLKSGDNETTLRNLSYIMHDTPRDWLAAAMMQLYDT